MTPRERLTPKEVQIAILVWEGLTNREIGKIVGTSEQVIKNHLRSTFDKSASGAAWNWPCTSPVTAGRTGLPSPSGRARPIARRSGLTSGLLGPLRSIRSCGVQHSETRSFRQS